MGWPFPFIKITSNSMTQNFSYLFSIILWIIDSVCPGLKCGIIRGKESVNVLLSDLSFNDSSCQRIQEGF